MWSLNVKKCKTKSKFDAIIRIFIWISKWNRLIFCASHVLFVCLNIKETANIWLKTATYKVWIVKIAKMQNKCSKPIGLYHLYDNSQNVVANYNNNM